jgi:hypothetical protein
MSTIFHRLRLGRLNLALATSLLAVSANSGADVMANVLATANPSTDTGPSPEAMMADLIVVRPLGVAATVIGGGIFLVGLPFEAATGNFSGPARKLVSAPAKFTFSRPIGEIH